MLAKPPKGKYGLFAGLSCTGCPLEDEHEWAHLNPGNPYGGFSLPGGSGRNKVLVVLEALGKWERVKGYPLQGESGLVFDRCMDLGSMNRDDFVIYNTIACQHPNNWLKDAPGEHEALEHRSQYHKRYGAPFKPHTL